MGVKEYQFAGDNRHLLNEYHRQLDSLGEWIIQFDAFDKQDYGFDKVSNKKGIYSGSEYYPYLSANYDLRYKSVECYNSDKVIVDFGSYPEKDSVIFKDKYGVTLKLSKCNILNFTGVAKPDTNYIYAYRGDEKIGKLSVNTYKQKTYKVVLVSVNGAKLPDISSLQDSLNKYYKQSVVSFEVDTDTLNIKDLFPFSHGDKNCFSGFIPSTIAGQRGNGNRGVTPLKTNLPIWVDYDISDYSFITFALFHEICHRISAIGAISLIRYPIFKFYYSSDYHDADSDSMMASGEGENTIYKRMNGRNYTIDEMVAKKQNWKYNSKRNFVILYQLLLNLKKYNEIQ